VIVTTIGIFTNMMIDEEKQVQIEERETLLRIRMGLCLLGWIIIIISHVKGINYVYWSFVPMQVMVLVILTSFESTIYTEDI
jgi:hypothetical protein